MIIEVSLTHYRNQRKTNTEAAFEGLSSLALEQVSNEIKWAIRAENMGGLGVEKNDSKDEYPPSHLPAASVQAARSPAVPVVDHAKDTDLPYKLNLLPASSHLPSESAKRLEALHELYRGLHQINHAIELTSRYLPKLKSDQAYTVDVMQARKKELEKQLLALIEQQHSRDYTASLSLPPSELQE